MGHGAPGGHAVELVGDGAGRPLAPADEGGPGPVDGAAGSLGPAGAELQHCPPPGGPDDPVGLGGDEGLVVDGQQQVGLQQLGLDGRGPHGENGLVGEHRGPLGDGKDVPGELKVCQVVQEVLVKDLPAPEVGDVLGVKVEVLDVLNDLLQPGSDGIAPIVRDAAEEEVKVGDPIFVPGLEVSVAHGELIEVAQHGHVQFLICIHGSKLLSFLGGDASR